MQKASLLSGPRSYRNTGGYNAVFTPKGANIIQLLKPKNFISHSEILEWACEKQEKSLITTLLIAGINTHY